MAVIHIKFHVYGRNVLKLCFDHVSCLGCLYVFVMGSEKRENNYAWYETYKAC